MTQTISVEGQVFEFEDSWEVSKIDDWETYRKSILPGPQIERHSCCDILAVDSETILLIEVKDYRRRDPEKEIFNPMELAKKIAQKVIGSAALLFAVAHLDAPPALDRKSIESQPHLPTQLRDEHELSLLANDANRELVVIASIELPPATSDQIISPATLLAQTHEALTRFLNPTFTSKIITISQSVTSPSKNRYFKVTDCA